MANKFPVYSGHSWLLKLMDEFGYKVGMEGVCEGISNIAMQSFLANDLPTFIQSIHNIYKLSQLSEKEINKIKDAPFKNKIALNGDNYIEKFNINALFDGIHLYQNPEIYRHIFNKNEDFSVNKRPAHSIFFSKKENQPIKENNILCAYNKKEQIKFLELFQSTFNMPISILLRNSNHTVNLNFDPKEKKWLLINANLLPVEEFDFNETEQLTERIIKAFWGKETSLNIAEIYIRHADKSEFKKSFHQLKNNKNWIELQKITQKKVKLKDSNGASILYLAIKADLLQDAKKMLEMKIDVNHADEDGDTPLIIACENNNIEAINLLIKNGADVNLARNDGTSPLNRAVQMNHLNAVKLLIKHGADINMSDNKKVTQRWSHMLGQFGGKVKLQPDGYAA